MGIMSRSSKSCRRICLCLFLCLSIAIVFLHVARGADLLREEEPELPQCAMNETFPEEGEAKGDESPEKAEGEAETPTQKTEDRIEEQRRLEAAETASTDCTDNEGNCLKTGCCSSPNSLCRLKDSSFAQCMKEDAPCPPDGDKESYEWGCWVLRPPILGAAVPWPRLKVAPGVDAALEKGIEGLLRSMTLEQKVGQMLQAHAPGLPMDRLAEMFVGSLISGAGTKVGNHSPEDWTNFAQSAWETPPKTSSGDPIRYIWGIDAIHGHHAFGHATIFPHNIALGAANDLVLTEKIGIVTARELILTGLDWTFAPCVAIPLNRRWGRSYEGFAENPNTVTRITRALIHGLQGRPYRKDGKTFLNDEKVLATAKHWVADGGTNSGVNAGNADMPEEEIMAVHAAPYFAALEAGVGSVMISFSNTNGKQMHANEYMIRTILKGALGFDGLVVSDWEGHRWIGEGEGSPACTQDSCPQAVNAGIDLFMIPMGESWINFHRTTVQQVREGIIEESRIDDAAKRILRTKARMGLIPAVPAKWGVRKSPRERAEALRAQGHELGAPHHRAVAREAVRKSLVLLKNEKSVLPLKARGKRVLVSGRHSNSIALQSGGWTITWQGAKDHQNDMFNGATTIYEGIRDMMEKNGGEAVLSWDGEMTKDHSQHFDALIVVIGENPYAETDGDLPWPQPFSHARDSNGDGYFDWEVLGKARDHGRDAPVICVFLTGRPIYINYLLNLSDAFVVGWLPGSEGGGVADVLIEEGGHDFHGTLPFHWPVAPCQEPANGQTPLIPGYGHRYKGRSSPRLGTLEEHNIPSECPRAEATP